MPVFVAEQNAQVAKNAEQYYRAMVRGGADSWNLRDTHMVETLERLMNHHGTVAKAIVWEHNTHIGDARATDMARGGMVNVGQLVRQRQAHAGVVLCGFGTYQGTVIAGAEWGAPMEAMRVPDAREGSWEQVFHEAGGGDSLMLLEPEDSLPPMLQTRGHRAIGVVYDPMYEAFGNYVPTSLSRRYDAFMFIDETQALHPLHMKSRPTGEIPETYPTGM